MSTPAPLDARALLKLPRIALEAHRELLRQLDEELAAGRAEDHQLLAFAREATAKRLVALESEPAPAVSPGQEGWAAALVDLWEAGQPQGGPALVDRSTEHHLVRMSDCRHGPAHAVGSASAFPPHPRPIDLAAGSTPPPAQKPTCTTEGGQAMLELLNPAGEHVAPPPPALMAALHERIGTTPAVVPNVAPDHGWFDYIEEGRTADFVELTFWSALDQALYEGLWLAGHPSAGRLLGRAPFEAEAEFAAANTELIIALAAVDLLGEAWVAELVPAERQADIRAGADRLRGQFQAGGAA